MVALTGRGSTGSRQWWQRQIFCTRGAYFFTSLSLTTWYSQADAIQRRLDVAPAVWGALLTTAPLMTLITSRWYARVIPRHLGNRSLQVCLLCLALVVLCIGFASSVIMLTGLLLLLGVLNAALQVESNSRAYAVERLSGRKIFTSCHGFFSIGVLFAGLLAFGTASLNAPGQAQFILVACLGGGGAFIISRISVETKSMDEVANQSRVVDISKRVSSGNVRRYPMVMLTCLGFLLLGAESMVNTWHGVLTEDGLGIDGFSGAVFAAYAAGGILIRFSGDRARNRWGPLSVFIFVSPFASAALASAIIFPSPALVLVAFLFLGIALGIAYPDVLQLAANSPDGSTGGEAGAAHRVASVITLGTLGVLLSNPLVGLITDHASVTLAFVGLAVLIFALSLSLIVWRQRSVRD
jgi:MFS family permease